ncbi:MAG: LuxR C-terminal-related transcriptional regulator [Chloroflexota bacterium]
MARPIVDTKFYASRPRGSLVSRSRLEERLERGAGGRLTLIAAPAGFGKTTLLAEWMAASAEAGRATMAFVSLEQADNDVTSFWTSVAASVHRAVPSAGSASTMLQDAQSPPIESVLAALVNDLGRVEDDVTLVLDDYHVVDAADVQQQMADLIEHLPPHAHVVIATRADPAFPLARLRARGELVEIRAADMRFTADETATYLNEVAGLDLAASDVATLEARTEGWIAALQLAALSIQGRDDAARFIAGFAGDDRLVVDYLVEEVLQRQTDDVRAFLLDTSILDRLTGPLCDAVTGHSGGRGTLEALDRANLFVVPLDANRRWYRYHHLFADVLRARLLDERPEAITELHRRASEWFERNGERDRAIRHALAGENSERAAHLIELALPDLRRGRQDATLRRWLEALPREIFRNRPVLSEGYIGALMSNGELNDVDDLLDDAERWLDPGARTGSEMVVVDESAFARLPSAIAMYRAARAQLHGDREGTLAHARRGLELAGDDDPIGRGGAAGFLALAHWATGDLEVAHDYWTDAMVSLNRAGYTVSATACMRPLAEIRAAQGRLRDARRTYERGLELATAKNGSALRGAADMHTGLAELSLESNDLDAAADHLLTSTQFDERGAGLPQNASRRRIVTALLRAAEGDADAAIGLLDEAERTYVSEYFPVVRPIRALTARFRIARGRLADAEDWVNERGIVADDDLDYLGEFEHVTLARVLMARSTTTGDDRPMRDAVALLDRLQAAAAAGGRQRTVIEVLVLLAIARRALDDDGQALTALRRAMALAEPEAHVRIFIAEGPPMTALLELAVAHGISPPYARRLLAAGNRRRRQPLAEPLSDRELEVLRFLATDLDGPGIARELVVGLSTVRSHTKSIYAKLGVNGRRLAVRRGEELGLTTRTSH